MRAAMIVGLVLLVNDITVLVLSQPYWYSVLPLWLTAWGLLSMVVSVTVGYIMLLVLTSRQP